MEPRTYTANVYDNGIGGWRLYVTSMTAGTWPSHTWSSHPAVPTLAERLTVLAALGFAPAPGPDGAEWRWSEYCEEIDAPSSPAVLTASLAVQEVTR
ncbi:DUF6303 family protein [Streptomyces sp. NPDC059740]|uniref:DUF6303 family protein n=1 Tax=Streptomyces sp. NPDC059740 TaxID=3346926 RepID=UPI003658103B